MTPGGRARARGWHRHLPGVAAALTVAGLAAGVIGFLPDATAPLRERIFDAMIGVRANAAPSPVWVVEIGAENEVAAPFGRADLARVIQILATADPAVIGLDVVLSQSCGASADNTALATAIAQAPLVTGFLVPGPAGGVPHPSAPLAVMQDVPAWDADGAEVACTVFQDASTAAALVSLPGGPDGRVRMAPAAVFVGGKPFAAMGVELARRGQGWSTVVLGRADPGWLRLGDATIQLDALGQFRFVPTSPALRSAQTLLAVDLLRGTAPPLPKGAVILIGSSLAEKGGLRPSRARPLHPSVHLQADVVEQLMAGRAFSRPPAAWRLEAAIALLGGALALGLVMVLPPLGAALGCGIAAMTWIGFAIGMARWGDRLYDPLLPVVGILGAAAAGILVAAAASRRAEGNLSARMRQHLPDALVDRVADGSAPLHLTGEMREITALFTDIEGFSDLSQRIPPQVLVDLLDRYFTGLTRIVAAHGGMVDKIVGDAVHAFFNAPVDQPDHVDQAIRAAGAIRDFAADFARQETASGLGRTRIGVETGPAILGDVGQGGRTDYTAHGNAVNMAARLQEASKTLGVTVLIGPRAAGLTGQDLQDAGEVELRSFGRVRVSTLE
jgi:adenylate cyclase